MKKTKKIKLPLKWKSVFNRNFILYSNNINGIKECVKVNGEFFELDKPLKIKMFGVYRHSFPCSLKQALKSWDCWKRILKLHAFYHSIGKNKETYCEAGTKFNILLLPIVYLYSLIDTKMFHKILFF